MNKLTKIGASALCGSLVAVSAAHAGSLSVAGSATATWNKDEGEVTGNPLGMNSGMTFTGTGELDDGSTVTLTLTQADQTAYSAGSITWAIPGIGTLGLDQSGSGLDRLDDMMPTAWEETNGTGLDTGLATVAGVGGSTNIEWTIDSGMLPDGVSAHLAFTPRATGNFANDKASGGAGNSVGGSGYDIVIQHSGLADGLNVFGGISSIDQTTDAAARDDDREQYALGFTYAVGSVTMGMQVSKDDMNAVTGTQAYDNLAYAVSFAVNDDLTLSYGRHESTAESKDTAEVDNEAESFQVSYSMGGASIKVAETSVDNAKYSSANDFDGTTVALSLAF